MTPRGMGAGLAAALVSLGMLAAGCGSATGPTGPSSANSAPSGTYNPDTGYVQPTNPSYSQGPPDGQSAAYDAGWDWAENDVTSGQMEIGQNPPVGVSTQAQVTTGCPIWEQLESQYSGSAAAQWSAGCEAYLDMVLQQ
jgi:hypothetical protein